MMEEASSGRSTSRFTVCLWMRLVLLQIQSLKPRGKQTWKKMLAKEVVRRVDDAPAQRGYISPGHYQKWICDNVMKKCNMAAKARHTIQSPFRALFGA